MMLVAEPVCGTGPATALTADPYGSKRSTLLTGPISFSRITNSRIIDDPPFCSSWRPGLLPGFPVFEAQVLLTRTRSSTFHGKAIDVVAARREFSRAFASTVEHRNLPPVDQAGHRGDIAIQRPVRFHEGAHRADGPVDGARACPQPATASAQIDGLRRG